MLAILLPLTAFADGLAPGAYDVRVAVKIPNVNVSNADFTTRVCWRGVEDAAITLGPLGPGPLKDCNAIARQSGTALLIDTKCAGPNAGWAVSTYHVTPSGFRGTVNMNMGGKNMTVQEIQRGTRVGPCTQP